MKTNNKGTITAIDLVNFVELMAQYEIHTSGLPPKKKKESRYLQLKGIDAIIETSIETVKSCYHILDSSEKELWDAACNTINTLWKALECEGDNPSEEALLKALANEQYRIRREAKELYAMFMYGPYSSNEKQTQLGDNPWITNRSW